jgi:hypothetical protein
VPYRSIAAFAAAAIARMAGKSQIVVAREIQVIATRDARARSGDSLVGLEERALDPEARAAVADDAQLQIAGMLIEASVLFGNFDADRVRVLRRRRRCIGLAQSPLEAVLNQLLFELCGEARKRLAAH